MGCIRLPVNEMMGLMSHGVLWILIIPYNYGKASMLSCSKKIGKVFGSGNTVWREDFDGTSKSLNALHVKFNCIKGNEGGRFSECLK